MTSSVGVALSLTLMTWSSVIAFPDGPPIDMHPEICESMSPLRGHRVNPMNTAAPYNISVLTTANCHDRHTPITVSLQAIETHFEGLFVQARSRSSSSSAESYDTGTFDALGDSQLQPLTCGSQHIDNVIGQTEAHHYSNKVFNWTPNADTGDVYFIATVVREKQEYWLNVTSPTVRYDVNCMTPDSLPAAAVTSHVASVAAALGSWLVIIVVTQF